MEEDKAEAGAVAAVEGVRGAVGAKADRGRIAWVVPLPPAPVAFASAQNVDKRNPTREGSHACSRNVQNAGQR